MYAVLKKHFYFTATEIKYPSVDLHYLFIALHFIYPNNFHIDGPLLLTRDMLVQHWDMNQ